jgi:hypothetical protein
MGTRASDWRVPLGGTPTAARGDAMVEQKLSLRGDVTPDCAPDWLRTDAGHSPWSRYMQRCYGRVSGRDGAYVNHLGPDPHPLLTGWAPIIIETHPSSRFVEYADPVSDADRHPGAGVGLIRFSFA